MQFECPVCLEDFKDGKDLTPKVLKCGDTLCSKCIRQLTKNDEITCPLCNQKTSQKVEEMPTNKYANLAKKSIICNNCFEEYSNTFNGEKAPKILKCGDTLCLKCINNLMKDGKITCPFCKTESTEDIKDIPINKSILDSAENELYINTKYLNEKNIDIKDLNYQFSIGLMGEPDGGKTSITHYFHTGEPFEESPVSTVGFDYHYKYMSVDKKIIKVTLWDTAGQERFSSLSAGALRGVHGLLLVFAVSIENNHSKYNKWKNSEGEEKKKFEEDFTEKKFQTVEFWLDQFNQFNQQEKRVIYLIGNKVDDVENRIVKEKDALQFAKSHEIKYFETSAKTGKNIFKVFKNIIIDLIEIYPNKLQKRGTVIKIDERQTKQKKTSCCSRNK